MDQEDFEFVNMKDLTPDEIAKYDQNLANMRNWVGMALKSIQEHFASDDECPRGMCVGEEVHRNILQLHNDIPEATMGMLILALSTLAPVIKWMTPEEAMNLGLSTGDVYLHPDDGHADN